MPETKLPVSTEPPAREHRYFRLGTVISAGYLLILGAYSVCQWSPLLRMTPNEFGDYLAGVSAPLAFLWLVLGFRQQGDELQNSARQLWLQGEELKASVEQQRQLVEVSREQVAAESAARLRAAEDDERNAQPQLHIRGGISTFSGGSEGYKKKRFHVANAGINCSDYVVIANGRQMASGSVLGGANEADFVIRFDGDEEVVEQSIEVFYNDARGNRRKQHFHVRVVDSPEQGRVLGDPAKIPGYEKLPPPLDLPRS